MIDPYVVVCGSTFQYLFDVCKVTKDKIKNDHWYYYSSEIGGKERLFIDYYHPAAQYPALLLYYGLMNVYQTALLSYQNQKDVLSLQNPANFLSFVDIK